LVPNKKRLVVIGAGAAGFFCAVNAARLQPGLEVIILEKSNKLLAKVAISGGGRCNLTHACFDIAEMIKKYPRGGHFVKKTFHQFFTKDTIAWFTERGVPLKTEVDGRMFPMSNSSQTIIHCLLNEADKYGVIVKMQSEVCSVVKQEEKFILEINAAKANASKLTADFVCIACGGYPKTAMFDWLRNIGHSIESPVPSLFTFNIPGNAITKLMGIAVENAIVKISGTKLESTGPVLITHWGLSGPGALKLSAWGARLLAEKNYAFTAIINWVPAFTDHTLRSEMQQLRSSRAAQKIINKNPFALPLRLWEYFLQQCGITENTRWADLTSTSQNKLIKILVHQELEIKGKTTFKEEFVTAGGIPLNEIDAQTMESKKQPGLFFAGEILDVDGITGGFNFQHAWTSGWIAANSIGALAGNVLPNDLKMK
jgi:hypothetical protein